MNYGLVKLDPGVSEEVFITSPKLFVLARSALSDEVDQMYAYFGSDPQIDSSALDTERLIEIAGRTCYLSFRNPSGKTTAEYNKNLIRQRHESVLEHASWTFVLVGVSRAFTHQLVRHRVGFSFSQLSQQYVDHQKTRFVVPAEIIKTADLLDAWKKNVLVQRESYRELLERSEAVSKELDTREQVRSIRSLARSILPNCTEAAVAVTANARSWRHFLELRGSTEGDIEMRRVSAILLATLQREAPSLFSDFVEMTLADGWPSVEKIS
jgi:thymidylate synthase (FAD)